MPKTIGSVIVAILIVNVGFAAELITTKSEDMTSKDLPLKFVLEKTTWERGNIYIWGTVRNTGSEQYRHVQIIFTAKNAKGEFLGRKTWYVEPDGIGPRQVGYIERKFVECEERKTAKIEYSVIGDR